MESFMSQPAQTMLIHLKKKFAISANYSVKLKMSRNTSKSGNEHIEIVSSPKNQANVAAESTNARVKWWSIFQTGVLVGVCVFQVAYLKRFFG
jgi:hypothetical protein